MSSLVYDLAYTGDAPIGGMNENANDLGVPGQWPRLINLDEETESRLVLWLDDEIESFNTERAPLLEDWQAWQTLYWAEPETKQKNFPFTRAANVVIPLAAIAVEAIHARFMNTLFSIEPFFSIRPRSAEWITAAKPMEEYLQSEVETPGRLEMFELCNDAVMELTKLGTCVIKTGYDKVIKKSLRKAPNGEEEELYVTVKNGVCIDRVPLGNFIMRLNELDPQLAPMVGERHEFTWSQLKRMAQTGRIKESALEEIKTRHRDISSSPEAEDGNELQRTINQLSNTEPVWSDVYDVYELWCTFDVDGDGWDEEIVIDYHKESGTFLSIRYNWYEDLHRPYRIANYLNVEGVWSGIGVCKQVQQFQEEATTIHRQRLDNATLANMAQIVIRKDMGYGPGEPIFPGKMWFVDDVRTDIKEFKLSEVYPSSYANEESIVRYSDKRSGANDVILGVQQAGTPPTATSDLTRLAEGNKRFDLAMKNIKRLFSNAGSDLIVNMQLFGTQFAHWYVLGEDGQYVEKVLRMPSTLVRTGAVVDLTVTDSITNREVEQQQWLGLFQVITGYYGQVLQMAQLIGDPQLFMSIAQRTLMASDEAMRRLLETFTITDSERFAIGEDNPNGSLSGTPQGSIGGGEEGAI